MRGVIFFWAMAFFGRLQADCCPSGDSCTKIFSLLPQFLFQGEPIRFEKVAVQSREIDLSFASVAGLIIFNRSGVYKIVWFGEARSHFPWTLGFSLDGNILLGSVYGNSSRHFQSEKITGSVVLSINAGQVLRFVNASPHPVELIPNTTHPQNPLPSMTLSLSLFEPIYLNQIENTYGLPLWN